MKGLPARTTALCTALLLFLSAPGTARAYGEDTGGAPSLEERAVHLFTDRLRVEPDATDAEFSDYPPVAPLIYNSELGAAARFHADDMAENDCFQHESCDGTDFGERLWRYYDGMGIGENIALGSPDALTVVFEGWLYSPPHRDNMLASDWRELGTGFSDNDGGPPLWVQDFGFRGGEVEPITTSSTHWPLRPAANEEVSFFLAAYDPDGTPEGADLLFGGVRYPMEDDRGADGKQTFARALDADVLSWVLSEGDYREDCPSYYFELTRADGSVVSYPSEGGLLIPLGALGGSDCEPWSGSRPTVRSGCGGDSGLTGTGSGCQTDPDRVGGPDDNTQNSVNYSNCALAPQPRQGNWAVLAVLALQLRRRRR